MGRITLLADKLLASLAQFTHSMMLAQNHTRRQAPSTHRSCCSLIQRFQETPLISLTQNHMHTERCYLLSLALLRCSLIQRSWIS